MNTAVFTSSALRHKALGFYCLESDRLNTIRVYHERGKPLQDSLEKRFEANEEQHHLELRTIEEQKQFSHLTNFIEYDKRNKVKYVAKNWISSYECLKEMQALGIELILVYGTSILKGNIIDEFRDRILNVHLGLSPYYRGSSTNYFPFVNNEPEYVGATFMFLDEGIDSGEIIHQVRPIMESDECYHKMSIKFVGKMLKDYVKLAENYEIIDRKNQSIFPDNRRLVFRKKDFTKETLEHLHTNYSNGMIDSFLTNYQCRCKHVPIITQSFMDEKP